MAARIAVGEGHDISRFIREQCEWDYQSLITLAAGDGPANQTLAKQLEDSIVRDARQVRPRIDAKQCVRIRIVQFVDPQIASREDGGRSGKCHELWAAR
jgi:hypothetical protein